MKGKAKLKRLLARFELAVYASLDFEINPREPDDVNKED